MRARFTVSLPHAQGRPTGSKVRVAEMNALFDGASPPAPSPAFSRLLAAAYRDADVFRAMLETVLCVALPQEVMGRPYVAAKMAEFEGRTLPPAQGIDRDRLMTLLNGSLSANV
jgi:hypothetical protein